MESRNLRVGQPITPEQLDALSDAQSERRVPRGYREFFAGKDIGADGLLLGRLSRAAFLGGCFYLHDGTAWSFFKSGCLDE